ncbi:MAG: UvrD-helicase domain-containing protein [Lachnospiraceae bacterium]|nr:UvrD-helicase domain-containing protein [Lachnospiraceae bacterium]
MSIYDALNPQQQEAVRHYEGPLLILAGAGSGKTRVLTHRVAWLIEEMGVNPWNILAITFTNKAAGEMRERVDRILNRSELHADGDSIAADRTDASLSGAVWVSTFHSTCVRILRRYIDHIGFDRHFTIYDSDDQKAVIRDVCKRLNVDTKTYKERYFMGLISSAKDELIDPQEYETKAYGQDDLKMKMAARVYKEYQKQLHASNALDFDDLICKTVELFSECPEILDSYQERFRFIMVDEYQDTNTAQFKLVSQLASKYRNLCVVGDDDQSIYRFRGANIGNILNFEEFFPDAKVIRLEQNYRSTQNILSAANEVIKKNVGRKEKTLWTSNGEGAQIHFRQFMNGYQEAEYVADRISTFVYQGKASYKDFAVLYRTNAQSRMFEEKFLLANISYKIVGAINFYARKEIKDVLAYLKTIDNAEDDLAVRRIINVPRRGIGATSIARVQDYALAEEISFYRALGEAARIPGIGRGLAKLEDFVQMIQTFRSKADFYSVRELIEDVLEVTGYRKELELEGGEEAKEREENIDELLNKAAAYDQSAEEPSLSGFLEEVALVADIDDVSGDNDQVLMMTLHSAKGLEFPTVFLVGMEDGLFPSYMSIHSEDMTDLEEERRLCYVGITRAQKELYLTAARQRMVRGEVRFNRVSRFVEDIPQELLQAGGRSSRVLSRNDAESDAAVPFTSEASGRGQMNASELSFGGRSSLPGDASGSGGNSVSENPRTEQSGAHRSQRAGNLNQNAYRQAKEAFQNRAFVPQQFEVNKSDGLDYTVGDRVKHIKFGVGTVAAIVEGGRDYEVTVEFDRVGTKKMFAAFAKLVKVD